MSSRWSSRRNSSQILIFPIENSAIDQSESDCEKIQIQNYKLKHESDTIVFSGEECNKSFPKNWKLTLHMRRVHGGKTFV